MPYILLVCATVSLLLLGCSDVRDKQERAADFVESAVHDIRDGVQKAGEIQADLTGKVRDAASELEHRTDQVQQGVEGVKDAVTDLKKSAGAIKGALE